MSSSTATVGRGDPERQPLLLRGDGNGSSLRGRGYSSAGSQSALEEGVEVDDDDVADAEHGGPQPGEGGSARDSIQSYRVALLDELIMRGYRVASEVSISTNQPPSSPPLGLGLDPELDRGGTEASASLSSPRIRILLDHVFPPLPPILSTHVDAYGRPDTPVKYGSEGEGGEPDIRTTSLFLSSTLSVLQLSLLASSSTSPTGAYRTSPPPNRNRTHTSHSAIADELRRLAELGSFRGSLVRMVIGLLDGILLGSETSASATGLGIEDDDVQGGGYLAAASDGDVDPLVELLVSRHRVDESPCSGTLSPLDMIASLLSFSTSQSPSSASSVPSPSLNQIQETLDPLISHPTILTTMEYVWSQGSSTVSSSVPPPSHRPTGTASTTTSRASRKKVKSRKIRVLDPEFRIPSILHAYSLILNTLYLLTTISLALFSEYPYPYHMNPYVPYGRVIGSSVGSAFVWWSWVVFTFGYTAELGRSIAFGPLPFHLPHLLLPPGSLIPFLGHLFITISLLFRLFSFNSLAMTQISYTFLAWSLPLLGLAALVLPSGLPGLNPGVLHFWWETWEWTRVRVRVRHGPGSGSGSGISNGGSWVKDDDDVDGGGSVGTRTRTRTRARTRSGPSDVNKVTYRYRPPPNSIPNSVIAQKVIGSRFEGFVHLSSFLVIFAILLVFSLNGGNVVYDPDLIPRWSGSGSGSVSGSGMGTGPPLDTSDEGGQIPKYGRATPMEARSSLAVSLIVGLVIAWMAGSWRMEWDLQTRSLRRRRSLDTDTPTRIQAQAQAQATPLASVLDSPPSTSISVQQQKQQQQQQHHQRQRIETEVIRDLDGWEHSFGPSIASFARLDRLRTVLYFDPNSSVSSGTVSLPPPFNLLSILFISLPATLIRNIPLPGRSWRARFEGRKELLAVEWREWSSWTIWNLLIFPQLVVLFGWQGLVVDLFRFLARIGSRVGAGSG